MTTDEDVLQVISRIAIVMGFWSGLTLIVTYLVMLPRAIASKRIRPGKRATVLGTVVDAPELLPAPVPGVGPCVFWASQRGMYRFWAYRGRMFRLRSALHGDMYLSLYSDDIRGMGFVRFLLTEEEVRVAAAHELAALDESVLASGADPDDYEIYRNSLVCSADGRTASDEWPVEGGGPKTCSATMNIVRVGDQVAIRGYFQPVDAAGFGYRDRVESVPTYRVAGCMNELLARTDSAWKSKGTGEILFVERGSSAELRSFMRVIQPRWLVFAFFMGMFAPTVVAIATLVFGVKGVASPLLFRWY